MSDLSKATLRKMKPVTKKANITMAQARAAVRRYLRDRSV
jgi:hypothetical protein